MIFDIDTLYKTPLDNMRLYKKQYRSMITNDVDFTSAVCNFVIGALTPNATCAVNGTFFANGDALNKFIRKVKQILDLGNRKCVLEIADTKKYVIDNSNGFVTLCEAGN